MFTAELARAACADYQRGSGVNTDSCRGPLRWIRVVKGRGFLHKQRALVNRGLAGIGVGAPEIQFAVIPPPKSNPGTNHRKAAGPGHSAADVVQIHTATGDPRVSIQRDGGIPVDSAGIDRAAIQDQLIGGVALTRNKPRPFIQRYRACSQRTVCLNTKCAAVDDGPTAVGIRFALE